MKNLLLVLLLFILSLSSQAQQNLVPNPSFEDTVYCPFGTNQMDACSNWMNFGNSPDYFNTCTGFGGPPFNYGFGYQYTHTGNAMAGLATYRRPNSPSGPNYREFIGTRIISTLIVGQKYFFSFNANFSSQIPVAIACSKIGLRLSTVLFDSCCPPPINNFAHLYTDSVLSDSTLWIKLSGSFIADSAYQFLAIGNFFDDFHTDTLRIGNIPDYSYYYIDDVCVSSDSIYNETWTSLNVFFANPTFNIFPNPSSEFININSNFKFNLIEIYNLLGEKVKNLNVPSLNNFCLDVSNCANGLYFVKVINKTSSFTIKAIINH